MKTPETREKEKICKHLDSIGAWYCKPATYGFGKSGTPDIVFCYFGYFGTVEVKREGEEPTALQKARMAEVVCAGGFATWGTAARAIPIITEWAKNRCEQNYKSDPTYMPGKPRD